MSPPLILPLRVAALMCLLPAVLTSQQPNTLIEIDVRSVAKVTVEAVITADSLLLLPAGEVFQLLGLGVPTTNWITPQALAKEYPSLVVTWLPREMRVRIEDPMAVLPATRQLRDQRERQARAAPPYLATRSGPFLAFTADDRGENLVDVGYSHQGKVALQGQHSTGRGTAWGLSVVPSPRVFLSYSDGDHQPPTATARLAAGPMWAFASWTPDRWSADGLVTWGRVSLFASSREAFSLTINAVPVGAQIGWSGGRTTARITYGPIGPSPFVVPQVP